MISGVNVIGYVSGNFGLSIAARTTIAALLGAGVPVACVDIDLGDGRARQDLTYQHLFVSGAQPLPHPITIVHINPNEARMVRAQFPQLFHARFNAIVPFWELPVLQAQWIPTLSEYDLILAPTTFVAAAIANVVPVPLRLHPIACEAIAPSPVTRTQLGIPENRFVFATSFDRGSGANRKNPGAVLRAFELAFRDDDRAFLLVKVNGLRVAPEVERMLANLDPSRYRVIEGAFSYKDVLGIYNACDAFVSLHRAEGLGLGPMEAMQLGKAVISTGWSGNMDYMTDDNALLVNYAFTPVVDGHFDYSRIHFLSDPFWAEPDAVHAARLMRRLVDEPGLAQRLGETAKADVKRRAERFYSAQTVRTIVAAYEAALASG